MCTKDNQTRKQIRRLGIRRSILAAIESEIERQIPGRKIQEDEICPSRLPGDKNQLLKISTSTMPDLMIIKQIEKPEYVNLVGNKVKNIVIKNVPGTTIPRSENFAEACVKLKHQYTDTTKASQRNCK